MSETRTVQEIAEHIGGSVLGDGNRRIHGASSIAEAGPDDLIFVESVKYARDLAASRAGAAILPEGMKPPEGMSGILFPRPALGMARALDLLYPRQRVVSGVSSQAYIGEDVEIAEGVGIGPGAYIGDRVRIGKGTEIHALASIAHDSRIGEDCIVHSGAHVYADTIIGNRCIVHSGAVIGADGFGFTQEKVEGPGASSEEPIRHRKVQQVGRVVLEDDVEIGANTCIDRAAFDVTLISHGTKIDDLVMIAHNCRIGPHGLLVSQVGIAGSTTIGSYVTIAGQAGLADHLRIGNRVVIAAKGGVSKDIPDGAVMIGAPAIDIRQGRKAYSIIEHLPEMKKTISDLESRLQEMERKVGKAEATPEAGSVGGA